MKNSPPPPFSYHYSPGVPELLLGLNCSVAISTYQTGKVVIFSAQDRDRLVQLPRNFQRPMGMALDGDKWAIGLKDSVMVTANSALLAKNYPASPNTYDALFVPRISYFTGPLDIHDLAWAGENLVAVNTRFSCLMEFGNAHSFTPIWQPPWITELMPEDRCHMNGLALENGKPKYVTMLGTGNEKGSWRKGMLNSGVLMDVTTNEIILDNLPTPHSPRLYDDGLYMQLSATGELVKVDIENRTYDVMTPLNGFLRGMDRIGDYMFISMSKLRQTSSLFKEAPIAKRSVNCGVSIVYIPTGKQVGYILYHNTVEELFEVKVLPDMLRPNILNQEKGLHKNSVVTETDVFWNQQTDDQPTDKNGNPAPQQVAASGLPEDQPVYKTSELTN